MLETAFGRKQQFSRIKILQHGTSPLANDLRRFNAIASLIHYSDREFPLKLPFIPKGQHIVAEGTIFERDLVDSRPPEGVGQVIITSEVDALPAGVSTTNVQSNLDVQPLRGMIERVCRPHSVLGKSRPGGLVKLDELTADMHRVAHLLIEDISISKGQIAIRGVEIRALVIRELGQHMRSDTGYFHLDFGRGHLTSHLPVMRKSDVRVLDLADHRGNLDAESGRAISSIFHPIEGKAIHAFLHEVVHILSSTLAVGDDVEPKIHLVFDRPADDFIRLLTIQSRFF